MTKHDMRTYAGELTKDNHFKIECQLGWREYTERFREGANARLFVETMLGRDKPRWKSETQITAKANDTLKISCDRLEEVMDARGRGKLPDATLEKIEEFLRGVWHQQNAPKEERTKSTSLGGRHPPNETPSMPMPNGDAVTLREICGRHSWDERRARQLLRKAGEPRPEGRWAWGKDEVAGIEKTLQKLGMQP